MFSATYIDTCIRTYFRINRDNGVRSHGRHGVESEWKVSDERMQIRGYEVEK